MLIIYIILFILLSGFLFILKISRQAQGWLNPLFAIGLLFPQNKVDIQADIPIDVKRQKVNALSQKYHGKLPPVHTENITIVLKNRKFNARIYYPIKNSAKSILYFHGGGFMLGSIKSTENICRWLCKYANVEVLSFDYPLAPENQFPIPIEISYQAFLWYYKKKATSWQNPEIYLCGDSAGGNISAVISLMCCQKKSPLPKGQCLIYPILDVSRLDNQSYQDFGEGYQISKSDILYFRKHYVPNKANWKHPYISPLLHDIPENMPPSLIITAQFDVLAQEGRDYAEKLKNTGIPVEFSEYKGMTHGFISVTSLISKSHKALRQTAKFIKNDNILK